MARVHELCEELMRIYIFASYNMTLKNRVRQIKISRARVIQESIYAKITNKIQLCFPLLLGFLQGILFDIASSPAFLRMTPHKSYLHWKRITKAHKGLQAVITETHLFLFHVFGRLSVAYLIEYHGLL